MKDSPGPDGTRIPLHSCTRLNLVSCHKLLHKPSHWQITNNTNKLFSSLQQRPRNQYHSRKHNNSKKKHKTCFIRILSGTGLRVSALISGSSSPGSSPGPGHCVVFLEKTLFSTQVYKWVQANLVLGVNLRWTSVPSRGEQNTPSYFMLQKLG